MYGYQDTTNGFTFGLNSEVFLKQFELQTDDNKNFLQISFQKNDKVLNTRIYEITEVIVDSAKITDQNHPEFKKAQQILSGVIIHIVSKFIEKDILKTALARPINSFTDYCKILIGLLPKDFSNIPLDLFLQYEWSIKQNTNRTFLQVPKKVSYGVFLVNHVEGNFEKVVMEKYDDNTSKVLRYVDKTTGVEHPFHRNGWFMNSNFAILQQKDDSSPMGNNKTSPTEVNKPIIPF